MFSTPYPVLNVFFIILYVLLIFFTVIRILLDTQSSAKSLAYIILVLLFPVLGSIFYFSVGTNYRHKKQKNRAVQSYRKFLEQFMAHVLDETDSISKSHPDDLKDCASLVQFIHNLESEYLSKNEFKLLVNGEEKFPDLLKELELAHAFIHMEYYAWENDIRGNQVKDVLLRKAAEGVKVKVLYDAYASRKIKKNIARELEDGGVEIRPVIKIRLKRLANRLNHRDHRKIIIIDGHTGYLGGINVSDRYDNSIDTGLYWRDTHVRVRGPAVLSLQKHFLAIWHASVNVPIEFDPALFPAQYTVGEDIPGYAQIVAGGPIYPLSNIMLTYGKVFSQARGKLYITNPYFIPSESILDILKQSALSGVDVRLMLPDRSDSAIVGAASRFYFKQLLQAGVRIFLYRKGFVHAKTVVADSQLSIVGTANMDIRSFDLNFEIMPVIYSKEFGRQLEKVFMDDLQECREVTYQEWLQTGKANQLIYASARLVSSFL